MLGIADALTDGAMADSLLKVANLSIEAKNKAIASQDTTISKQDERHLKDEHALDECEIQKKDISDTADKKLKWTKVGWIATTIGEAILIVYFMIKP